MNKSYFLGQSSPSLALPWREAVLAVDGSREESRCGRKHKLPLSLTILDSATHREGTQPDLPPLISIKARKLWAFSECISIEHRFLLASAFDLYFFIFTSLIRPLLKNPRRSDGVSLLTWKDYRSCSQDLPRVCLLGLVSESWARVCAVSQLSLT